jgi:transmembrane sensor
VNKELLKRYFQNACSPEELEEVNYFLSRPESGKIIQEVLDEEWATFETPKLDEKELDNYRKRFLAERNEKLNPKKVRPLWRKQWLKYAAIFLLATGFGFYSILRNHNSQTNKVVFWESKNPNGQRSVVTLPDSTIVYLGAGSKIKFPESFTGSTREIALEGEAFFQVKKDHKHPFIIHTGSIQTKVLGTSFKIEAFKGQLFTVSVATGKVRVDQNITLPTKHLNSLAVLIPGQKVTYNAITDKASVSSVSIDDLQQWKMGNLIFDKERMDEVAAILERYYDVRIQISSKEINAYRINTFFKANESVDKVLRILSATANFNYNIQGKQITIKRR